MPNLKCASQSKTFLLLILIINNLDMAIIKIIELISELDNSWKDVVEKAVTIASKTYEIFNQYGLEIQMQRL